MSICHRAFMRESSMKRGRGGINVYQNKITIIIEGLYRTHNVFYKYNSVDFCLQVLRIRHFVSFWIKLRQFTFFIKPPWRNWLARSAVNRKVGGLSPPGGDFFYCCWYFPCVEADAKSPSVNPPVYIYRYYNKDPTEGSLDYMNSSMDALIVWTSYTYNQLIIVLYFKEV